MASLPAPYPSSNLAVRILKTSTAASNHSRLPNHEKIMTRPDIALLMSSPADTQSQWWAPLFGIRSSDPEIRKGEEEEGDRSTGSDADSTGRKAAAARAYRSGLTAEKARVLRKEMRAMESWHDPCMYHSAIAARLASPDHDHL